MLAFCVFYGAWAAGVEGRNAFGCGRLRVFCLPHAALRRGLLIRLRLKAGRDESVRRRHPWLFSGAVASREGDGSDGLAEVLGADGRPLARGVYSPESQILARLWTFDGRAVDGALFASGFRGPEGSARP